MAATNKNLKFNLIGSFLVLILIVLGVFVLKENQKPVPKTIAKDYSEIQDLKQKNLDFRGLSNFFRDLAMSKGGEYAYKSLALAANSNYLSPNVDTHLLGHVVGDILYKQEGVNGIKVCTNDLRNACSHSIVVGALLEQGASVLNKIVSTCEQAPGGIGAYGMCVHGLGHGVLAYKDYDMRAAVDLCKQTGTTTHGDLEITQCISGATMEMVSGVHDPVAWAKQKDNYLLKNDPLAPCDQGFIPAESKSLCYTYLTPHLFEAAGADIGSPDPKYYRAAMSFCDKIPKTTPQDRGACFGSFGKEFVVLANARNVQNVQVMTQEQLKKVYDWCIVSKITEALIPCIDSAVSSLYWGGENDVAASIRFCSAIDNTQNQTSCFGFLTNQVSYYISDHSYKVTYCGNVPESFQSDCRKTLSL